MKELMDEFKTIVFKDPVDEFKLAVHKDPISLFLTEDDIYMAVLQQEILNNPMPIGQEFPLL